MANFLFYKYHFERVDNRNLFNQEGKTVSENCLNDKLVEHLSSVFNESSSRSLNLYDIKTDRSGVSAPELYPNEVMRFDDGIALLQIHNNKHKKIMPKDSTVAQEVEHYPYCWVIIDMRPGSQAILVQQKRESFRDSDAVAGMIEELWSNMYGQLGWELMTEERFCKGSIWDVVKLRTKNDRDRVRSVSIKIDGKRPNEANEVDKALQLVLDKFAAPEGELKLTSGDPARKILDETKEDMRRTVDLLIENQYRMRIGFEKSGVVEFGKEAEAVYGIEDGVCDAFVSGETTFDDAGRTTSNLRMWLDAVVPEDEEHIYSANAKERKNGRRRCK